MVVRPEDSKIEAYLCCKYQKQERGDFLILFGKGHTAFVSRELLHVEPPNKSLSDDTRCFSKGLVKIIDPAWDKNGTAVNINNKKYVVPSSDVVFPRIAKASSYI